MTPFTLIRREVQYQREFSRSSFLILIETSSTEPQTKRIVELELQSAEKSDLSMFILQYKSSGFSDRSMLYLQSNNSVRSNWDRRTIGFLLHKIKIIIIMRKQGEVPNKEGSKHNYSFNSTSIQHLYQLLAKNTQSSPESFNETTSPDRRSSLPRDRTEQFRMNIHYSRKDEREEKQQVPPKVSQISTAFEEIGRRRKQSVRQNKSNSVEATNRRLKSIILGYRPEEKKKKHSFFSSLDEQTVKGQSPNANVNMMMEISPRICIKTQASAEVADSEADRREKNEFNRYLYNYKQSIKLRPIQYYVRRTKNKKLSIMGVNMEPRQRTKKAFNKTLQLEEVEISLLNTQSILRTEQETNKKKNLSNLGQMRKKSSIQSLLKKCLPFLMASEHVLRKVEAMTRFYHIFLLSFSCFLPQREASELPKFHKKNVKIMYFVGVGNNRQLIAQLMQKRWWWKETNNLHEATFVWSQQRLKQTICQRDKMLKEQETATDMKQQMGKADRRKRLLGEFKSNSKLNSLFLSCERVQTEQQSVVELTPLLQPQKIANHLQFGKHLGNKKTLFSMLKLWFLEYRGIGNQLFSWIPQTYHIETEQSPAWEDFNRQFTSQGQDQSIWIVKPGQNSNRGRGIFLTKSLSEIKEAVPSTESQGSSTLIVQKYMSNLLLYNGRKFDIRAYLLCITIAGTIKYFWYSEGYLRTSSNPFSLKDFNVLTHLTNDAIQSQGEQYGRFQKGNKLSYAHLQLYLDEQNPKQKWKVSDLLKSMKKIAKTVAKVSYPIVNPQKSLGFQLFGMDFLVDSGFKPWLLQVNTNPCLELSSPLLQMLIPNLIENVLRLSLDPIFPPSMLPNKQSQYSLPDKIAESNKFQLIFDSLTQSDIEWEKIVTQKWGESSHPKPKQPSQLQK